MDMEKVFKIMNYVLIAVAGLAVLGVVLVLVGANKLLSTPEAQATGVAGAGMMILLLGMLPTLVSAALAFLTAHAGLTLDVSRCRKLALYTLIVAAVSVVMALKDHALGFTDIFSLAFYGFYYYLAQTQM